MSLPNACPKPPRSEKKSPKPINRASQKAKDSGALMFNSTIKRTPKKFEPAVLGVNRFAGSLDRSAPMPPRAKRIPRRNPERAAKRDKAYRAGLKRYHASETATVVNARAGNRCEFMLAIEPERMPRVIAVRVDRMLPTEYLGHYTRCNRYRRKLQHHHLTYARFGGDELPEDMLLGCPGCHEYVEAMKPAHRKIG